MKILFDALEFKNKLGLLKDVTIGFVPTMGALHQGHISLVEKAKLENDIVVVSIFLNSPQFDNKDDFNNYPSNMGEDIAILDKMNVDFLFIPTHEKIYTDNFTYQVEEKSFSKELCGKSRDAHFTGVLTVVMKLLNIVNPTKAYFGEKDRQQLVLIHGMVDAFFMNVEIVASPTIRESNGLAMSSRNRRLNGEEKQIANLFPKLLGADKSDSEIAAELNRSGFKTDYIETLDGIRYGAVFLGNIRLIDNVKL